MLQLPFPIALQTFKSTILIDSIYSSTMSTTMSNSNPILGSMPFSSPTQRAAPAVTQPNTSTPTSPPSNPLTRRRTPSTSSRGAAQNNTDEDDDHDEYIEGDELDDEDEADHDPSQQLDGDLDETTVKSGYLWKKGEKRKVSISHRYRSHLGLQRCLWR